MMGHGQNEFFLNQFQFVNQREEKVKVNFRKMKKKKEAWKLRDVLLWPDVA